MGKSVGVVGCLVVRVWYGGMQRGVAARPSMALAHSLPPTQLTPYSDTEYQRWRELKRAADKGGHIAPRRPSRLWRSARERGVWLSDLQRAVMSGNMSVATWCTSVLCDR